MIKSNKTYLSRSVCWKVAEEGKDQYDAYLFAKLLSSFVHHPILLNFKSNFTSFRLLTGYTDRRFRYLLNSAISYGFAKYEGGHLRLIGRKAEKSRFGKRRYNPEEVRAEDIRPFFQMAVIENNILRQTRKVNSKSSASIKGRCSGERRADLPGMKKAVNTDVTMSCRNAAKLLGVSVSAAQKILKGLFGYGLTLTARQIPVSNSLAAYYKHIGSPNLRFNKISGEYSYVLARVPESYRFKARV